MVERRLVLPRVLVDGILVHDSVIHHDGQPIDESILGDGLGLDDAGPFGFGLRARWDSLRRRGGDCS
jgi:hypothetical protein